VEINNIQTKESLGDIERDIIEFIIDCPLFKFEKMKYAPIMAYFFTRKRLTQEKIKKLTGFSAGMVSEGLNYLLQEGCIKLKKVKGVRKRFYELTSIAYYNYLQLFRIFKSISELYTRLNVINDELEANKAELKNTNGYSIMMSEFFFTLIKKLRDYNFKLLLLLKKNNYSN